MLRFHFHLAPALERARANETLARDVLIDARLARDEVAALLAAVESRLADERAHARTVHPGGAGAFAAAEAATIVLAALEKRRLHEVERARALLARARDAYARATSQRRALERLRERRLDEYRAFVEACESAEADEANSLRSNAAARDAEPGLDEAEVRAVRNVPV